LGQAESPRPRAAARWSQPRPRSRQARSVARSRTPPVKTGPHAVMSLVRQRNFGPYFFGNALSASGGWFQNLAASLLVYRLTHSPFLLGLLNFCQFIPVLVLVPWTGSAADRFDRRRLLLAAQTTAAALAAILSVLAWS